VREKNVRAGETGADFQVGIASDVSAALPSELASRYADRQKVRR